MTQWPHDDTQSKNAFYGDFHSPGWQDKWLHRYLPPFKMYYGNHLMDRGILVHDKIIPALTLVFQEIWAAANKDQDIIDKIGVSAFGGCFDIRNIAGSNNWSNHSWACAIDLDPNRNGFNTGHGHMQPVVINAFKRQGFLWGGDYRGRTDPMHFEAVSR